MAQPASDQRSWPADKVTRRPLGELLPYARNARTHSEAQIAYLARLIERYGWTMPVLLDQADGIIAGHGRILAAAQLGLDTVPCMIAKGWTEQEVREYRIADNQSALLAGWDQGLLAVEISELEAMGGDLSLLGFSDDELAAFLHPPSPGLTDPDEVPEPPVEPVSVLGDLWLLGRHRLLCGNSTLEDDVKRLVNMSLADMVFTDPPYGVAYSGSSKSTSIAGDITQTAIPIAFKQAIDHATKKDARLYFCGGSNNVSMYYSLFNSYLRKMPFLIIWDKGNIVLRRNNYHSQFEIIFYGWKGSGGDGKNWFGGRKADAASDIWRINRDPGKEYLHPTQKPVALASRAIENSCQHGGVIFEPFSGSGSTIIAAEMTGRACHAIELSEIYCDVAVLRWQNFTGQAATHAETGRSFAELAADRGQSPSGRSRSAT